MSEPINTVRPQAAALTPEEVLSNSLAPVAAAVTDYGRSKVDLAKAQLSHGWSQEAAAREHERAMQLVDARLSGEKSNALALEAARAADEQKLADINNKAHLDWVSAQAKAYVDRLDESSLNARALDLQKHGVEQQTGESLRDYVQRGTAQVVNHTAAALKDYRDQLAAISTQRDTLAANESNRQQAFATQEAAAKVLTELDATSPKVAQAVRAKAAAGFSMPEAIAAVPQAKSLFSEQFNTLLPQVQAMHNPEFQQALGALDKRENYITIKHNALLNTPFGSAAQYTLDESPAANPFPMPAAALLSNGSAATPGRGPSKATATSKPEKAQPQVSLVQFLPDALKDPQALALVSARNPRYADLPPEQILSNTIDLYNQDLNKGQAQLQQLGATVDTQGNVSLLKTPPPVYGGGYGGVYISQREPYSVAELAQRNALATQILSNMNAAKSARDTLTQLATPAGGAAPSQAPAPTAVLQGDQDW